MVRDCTVMKAGCLQQLGPERGLRSGTEPWSTARAFRGSGRWADRRLGVGERTGARPARGLSTPAAVLSGREGASPTCASLSDCIAAGSVLKNAALPPSLCYRPLLPSAYIHLTTQPQARCGRHRAHLQRPRGRQSHLLSCDPGNERENEISSGARTSVWLAHLPCRSCSDSSQPRKPARLAPASPVWLDRRLEDSAYLLQYVFILLVSLLVGCRELQGRGDASRDGQQRPVARAAKIAGDGRRSSQAQCGTRGSTSL